MKKLRGELDRALTEVERLKEICTEREIVTKEIEDERSRLELLANRREKELKRQILLQQEEESQYLSQMNITDDRMKTTFGKLKDQTLHISKLEQDNAQLSEKNFKLSKYTTELEESYQ